MKQEEIIPAGMRAASFTLEGNKMTIFFEPEKYVPKVGDCVKITYNTGNVYFFEVALVRFNWKSYIIHSGEVVIGENGEIFKAQIVSTFKSIEQLTPEEFQAEFEKLGYVYDFETHTAHKKRWRAEKGCEYYFFSNRLEVNADIDIYVGLDNQRHNIGNYFKTEEDAEAKVNEIKKLLKQ